MRILLDTNVLCRLAGRGHALHFVANRAVAKLRTDEHELYLVPQVLYEYWVVVTRPIIDNGMGMTTATADTVRAALEQVANEMRAERAITPRG